MNKIKIFMAVCVALCLFLTSSCSFVNITNVPSDKNTERNTSSQYNSNNNENVSTTGSYVYIPETIAPENTTENIYVTPPTNPEPSVTPTETQPVTPSYSSYTKEQILDFYKTALIRTRNYKGNLTVKQTESFDAEVKEATPNNSLVKTLANYIVDLVGSEGNQELVFSNGTATNKDKETVPILLPQRTEFTLTADGLASAEISESGEYVHVKMVLVPETVAMGEVPKHNASAIGYLDTSNMSFSIIKISRVDIGYTGSVIDAYIRSDGYIQSVTYTINMSTYAELSGMGISGSGTLEGAQTEKWELVW